MFRTDLLSIISIINTVFTASGICNASYVDCLLATSGWNTLHVLLHHIAALVLYSFSLLFLHLYVCLLGIDEFDIQRTVHSDIF